MRIHLLLILLFVGTALAHARIRRQSPSSTEIVDDPMSIISSVVETVLEPIQQLIAIILFVFNKIYDYMPLIITLPIQMQINTLAQIAINIINWLEGIASFL